jgi:ribosomal-protein-alanine N-acetyltransferase
MKEKKEFISFKELTTERLLLRSLKAIDKKEIFVLRSDPGINKYIARPKPINMEEALQFIRMRNDDIRENKSLYWAITLKGNPRLIGTICLWNFSEDGKTAEIGYELFPHSQGKGIMDEAVKKVIAFAFQTLGLHLLEAFTHKDNLKSRSLLSKNNFLPDITRTDEDNKDNAIFVLMKQNPDSGLS